MVIIRITIHVDGAEAQIHYQKVYTTEHDALQGMNEALERYKLSDGCTMMSCEDVVGVNAHLSELFDDPYNIKYYVAWEDITWEVHSCIAELFDEHQWPGSMLLAMANELGINLYEIET